MSSLFGRRRPRAAGVLPLQTARLHLVAITPETLAREPERAALGVLLSAEVPAAWPPELWEPAVWTHIAAQLASQPETLGWHRYMLSAERSPRLIGCVGGFPCAHGDVELGYSVAAPEQGKGFATEAVGALVAWFLEQPAVHSVSAQALSDAMASVRVMQRSGMVCVGEGEQPGTVRYRRWALHP